MARFSVSSEICNAIRSASVESRAAALRQLARTLFKPLPEQEHASPLCGDVIATLHQQTMARIYESLREDAWGLSHGEVEVAALAKDRRRDHAVCALSKLSALPVERIEIALSGATADLLLVICRAHNFAWSSVRALIDIHDRSMSNEEIDELHEEYHCIPLHVARRFGRFLQVHLNQSA